MSVILLLPRVFPSMLMLLSPPHLKSTPSLSGNDLCITVTSYACCLGAWQTPNLPSTIGIEKKQKIFAIGKDLFHGKTEPSIRVIPGQVNTKIGQPLSDFHETW